MASNRYPLLSQYLHGYAVSFEVTFQGDLDFRNWVQDFGIFSRSNNKIENKTPKEYFNWLLDHTVVIAEDDPKLDIFKLMDDEKIIQLRILPQVGCERFAEFLFKKINDFSKLETNNRVRVTKVTVFEHEKNSASYEE